MAKGLFTQDDIDTRMLYKEFQQGVDEYTKLTWGIVQKFIRKTVKESVKVWENGLDFVESAGGYLETWQKIWAREIDISLTDFALGFGFTKVAIQDSNSNELRETQASALVADVSLLAKRFFYRTIIPGASTTSRGFWDGNMTTSSQRVPQPYKDNTFLGTHNHYVASGAATPTLANINAIKKTIREHGYLGELYMFINSGLVEDLENLAGWTAAMTPVSVIETVSKEGFRAVKRFQEFTWIIEDWVPDGYLLAIDANIKPVTMREPLQTAGRGLKLYSGPYSDMPLREAYYEHRFDMEVVHRGAGAAMQITSGAWSDPSYTFTI